jgi:ATP-dependent DNA ligase
MDDLISRLKGTSKPKEKMSILKEYDSSFLRYIIHASYEPFLMYHIKLKKSEIPMPGSGKIQDLETEVKEVLNFCVGSKSPKQNREKVIGLLSHMDEGSQELLLGILDKNWKAGLGVRNILKVFPEIVSRFEVQLANTYKREKKYSFEKWIWSYKLDGLRCIALRQSSDEYYDKGLWTLYSRKGKEFVTVEHLKEQLEALYQATGWTFLDGELYKHGLAFEAIQGQVMGFKQGQAEEIEYHVFVVGQAEDFLSGKNEKNMIPVGGNSNPNASMIHFVNQGWCKPEEVEEKLEEAFAAGYEGIMLRDPDKPYDYKRSDALLKLKKGLNDNQGEIITDCVVDEIVYDDFPVIEDGAMHIERLLVKIWVKQPDGIRCKVGSGFDLDFRRFYTKFPEKLIGKVTEIIHQEWGSNGRMRFPRLHRVREDL